MRLTTMRLILPCMALATILAWSGSARADLYIQVYETVGGVSTTPYDISTPTAPGPASSLNVDPSNAGLLAAAPDFTFSGFGAISQIGATEGDLGSTGTIVVNPGGPNADFPVAVTLTILVSETGYTNPGPTYQMGSSGGYSSNGYLDSGDTISFQSFATPGSNTPPPFAMGNPSAIDSYTIATPIGSGSNPTNYSTFTASSGYTLTQSYTWVETNNSSNPNTLNVTGSTVATASAVPEPSSLVLLGLGSLGLLVMRRRRSA